MKGRLTSEVRGVGGTRVLRWRAGWLLLALLAASSAARGAESLGALINEAIGAHPAIQIQRSLGEGARAAVEGAGWQFYPTPSVAAEMVDASSSDPAFRGDNRVTTLRLQQPLWTGGRLTAGLERARAGALSAEADIEDSRQSIALRVVQAYGEWLSFELKLRALRSSMAIHQRLRDQLTRRFAGGASSESDLKLAQLRLETIVLEVTLAMLQQHLAQVALCELLGRKIESAELAAFADKPQVVEQDHEVLLKSALDRHPSVRRAQAQITGLEATIAERQADMMPEVFMRAERQHGDFSYVGAKPQNRLFIGLNTRFGAGLSNVSAVSEARARLAAGVAEMEARRREVRERVLNDHGLLASFPSRLASLENATTLAHEVFQSFMRQYLAGHRSWLDVMNGARELAQTEVQLADTTATQLVVSWRLAVYAKGIDALDVPAKGGEE